MKRVNKVILFVLLALTASATLAQGIPEGKWVLDLNATIERMGQRERAELEGMPEQRRAKVRESFEGRGFHFSGDGRAEVTYLARGESKLAKGSWSFDAGENRLTITAEGITRSYDVVWLSERCIRLILRDVPPHALFRSFVLVKEKKKQ
ncbi:MAG: hypothetical protein LPK03_01235 [Pontibacter sp.]|nr:hypothetical protein [Pontibacter sp.]